MIDGFENDTLTVDGVEIAFSVGGEGPPVLLLHGYPQTRAMWRRVAPVLAERCRVVAADLRGYGDSDKPPGGPDHSGYSKRAMAKDQVGLMESLGHPAFAVAGHDRGGRVAHRMARDHPGRVTRVAVLDIVPTATLFATARTPFATAYYHWFFLIQPDELPERLIGADPEWFVRYTLRRWAGDPGALREEDVREYVRCFRDPDAIRASCEDYRAAASIDLDHDREDDSPMTQPLLVLWGVRGAMERLFDVGASWRPLAASVKEQAIDCGHFLAEERPAETAAALSAFFSA